MIWARQIIAEVANVTALPDLAARRENIGHNGLNGYAVPVRFGANVKVRDAVVSL